MKKLEISYICEEFDLSEETILSWIKCRLIQPADLSGPFFDEEDLSRIRLISEVKSLYQVNDDAIEIILHLIDQIHLLNSEIRRLKI